MAWTDVIEPLVRGGDALLQRAHVGGERRLVAHGGRNAAEQRRHFGAGLREAEDVVDEEQHVLALVAEILGDREAGEADARARAGRLVHLAVHQRALGAGGRAVVLVRVLVDARLDELVIEVVALARALADAGEHRIAAVRLGDVVDQLLDEHGLADAGAAEQADLAALGVGRQQVDDLDAGHQDLRLGRLLGVGGRRLMDRAALLVGNGPASSTGSPMTLMMRPSVPVAHRHRDRLAGVGHFLAAHEAFGGVHGDGAHGVLAQMLGHLEDQPLAAVLGLERVQDRRQMAVELHVDDGAHHLADTTDYVGCHCSRFLLLRLPRQVSGRR